MVFEISLVIYLLRIIPSSSISCPLHCKCVWYARSTLVDVYCRSRGLTEFPRDIPNQAYVLDLQDNELGEVTEHDFVNLTNLYRLTLSNASLSKIVPGTFVWLQKLKYLSLDNNNLQELDTDTFVSLPRLQRLGLSNNKLRNINPNAFRDIEQVDTLDLYK